MDVPTCYVAISRVRSISDMLLAQPFSPNLFRLGPQLGPHMLVEWLEGRVAACDLAPRWQSLVEAGKVPHSERCVDSLKFPCAVCHVAKKWTSFAVSAPAGVDHEWSPALQLLGGGGWRKCTACTQSPKTAASAAQLPLATSHQSLTLRCSRCGYERPQTAYIRSELATLFEANSLPLAICVLCAPQKLRLDPTDSDARLKCSTCGLMKAAASFPFWVLKARRSPKFLHRCQDCADEMLRPACRICHERPTNRLRYPCEYYCESCAYPNCSVCKQKARPRNGKYHVKRLPQWSCSRCRASTPVP